MEESGEKNVHIMEECVPHQEESLQESLSVVYRLLHIQTKYKRMSNRSHVQQISTYKLACAQK